MKDNEITKVDYLKIDAQGADFSVVRSLGNRDVSRIQLEVVPASKQLYKGAADKGTIMAYLAEHGFVLEKVEVQSNGQEENLIFVRPTTDRLSPTTLETVSQEIADLYDVKNYATVAGTVQCVSGERIEVTTAPAQWAYAAVIPINQSKVPDANAVRLTFDLEVDTGILEVGVLNQAETDFIAAVTRQAGPQKMLELTVPYSKGMGRLVIRNASAEGPSHGWCRLVKANAEALFATEQEEVRGIEEALFFATQIRTSAVVLANVPPVQAGGRLLREIGEAAELLRPLLKRSGLSLIRSDPDVIKAIFSGLDVQVLAKLADYLKTLLPLSPIAGWQFDEFLMRPDLATLMRYALWRTLHSLHDPPNISLPWHGGTTFMSRFDNDLSLAMFVGGTYEPNELAFLDSVIRPGMKVLDGGANEGVYTLFLASKVCSTGRIVAVEPSSREVARLRANIAANSLKNVTVVASALAEQSGSISLKLANPAHAGQNTLGNFVYKAVGSPGTERIPATTIDELVDIHDLAGVDVIKLDLEGAELRALNGAAEVLRTARPLILLELSDGTLAQQGGSVAEVMAFLLRAHYKLLTFDRATGLPVPVREEHLSDNVIAVHRERDWGLAYCCPMERA